MSKGGDGEKKEGERAGRDSKPITPRPEKTFHSNSVTTQKYTTSISYSTFHAYKCSVYTHWIDSALYHSLTHIFRALFKQMHSWLNIEEGLWRTEQRYNFCCLSRSSPSREEEKVKGRTERHEEKAQREEEGREERMRGGKSEKSQQGCDYKKNDRKGEDGGWSRITKERRVRGELLHWAKHKMTDKVMYTRTEAKLRPWKTGSFILVTALTFTAWQM